MSAPRSGRGDDVDAAGVPTMDSEGMERVDLRSDTVTRPGPAMRRVMAEAEVGDDVWGEDPTVRALQERVAELLGKASALYVPSGTMGNQLALAAQSRPGDQLICHVDAHVHRYEGGAPAALAGLQVSCVVSEDGAMPWEAVREHLNPDDVHCAPPAILAFENTHNRCGGRILDPAGVRDTARRAREAGLAVHLDGARLWNAAVASGTPLATLAADADTVSVCFSKGLGAPVGSVLAGPEATVRRAHRLRKRWGGAMRQVGHLAAACLYALDHHVERLAEDHARARRLAAEVEHPELRCAGMPDTNIVLFDVVGDRDSGAVTSDLAAAGVLVSSFGPRRVRMVTHLDVDDAAVDRALEAIRGVRA